MSRIVEPGDVKIKFFNMTNKATNASVNPIGQIEGFDIYEDMSKPTLYATFLFNDSIGLLENFPIIGEEVITVEIETPGVSSSTKFTFRSFEVSSAEIDPNGKGKKYLIRCVSEEHLYNGSSAVSQSFEGTISDIVPIIVKNYLNTKKDIILDATKGIQTIVIPRLNPLQTIDMLRQRAVSKDYSSSTYVFFENQSGFNFKTIEGLIKDSKKQPLAEFNAQQNTTANKNAEARSFRTMLDYSSMAKADSNAKAAEGVFKAVTKSFDLSSKKLEINNFSLDNVFKQIQKPTDKVNLPNTKDFVDTFGSGVPKMFFVPKDTSRPDTFIDSMVAVRNSIAVLMNSEVTRVLIHGDSGIKVGDVVRLTMPSATGTTDKKNLDKMDTGNYLIIRLRHMLTNGTKFKHQVSFDCVKMGM